MPTGPHLTYTSALILQTLAAGHRYGFDIMEAVGLPSGTVYPALRRLEKNGLAEADWEARDVSTRAGRPRRRYYQITAPGLEALRRCRQRYRLLDSMVFSPAANEPSEA